MKLLEVLCCCIKLCGNENDIAKHESTRNKDVYNDVDTSSIKDKTDDTSVNAEINTFIFNKDKVRDDIMKLEELCGAKFFFAPFPHSIFIQYIDFLFTQFLLNPNKGDRWLIECFGKNFKSLSDVNKKIFLNIELESHPSDVLVILQNNKYKAEKIINIVQSVLHKIHTEDLLEFCDSYYLDFHIKLKLIYTNQRIMIASDYAKLLFESIEVTDKQLIAETIHYLLIDYIRATKIGAKLFIETMEAYKGYFNTLQIETIKSVFMSEKQNENLEKDMDYKKIFTDCKYRYIAFNLKGANEIRYLNQGELTEFLDYLYHYQVVDFFDRIDLKWLSENMRDLLNITKEDACIMLPFFKFFDISRLIYLKNKIYRGIYNYALVENFKKNNHLIFSAMEHNQQNFDKLIISIEEYIKTKHSTDLPHSA